MKLKLTLVLLLIQIIGYSQKNVDYQKSLVNYDQYEIIVQEVKEVREQHLISFDQLLDFQNDPNTVILDTRSKNKYEAKHLKGAINLPFTEFTTANLRAIIPDTNTRIVIYCNNNFKGDPIYFAGKFYTPEMTGKKNMIKPDSIYTPNTIMLALNIPTYLGLYGYGYRNIYELNELVNIDDERVELDGNNGIKTLPTLSK